MATGALRAGQILFSYSTTENTIRNHGVDAEDALTLAEGLEV